MNCKYCEREIVQKYDVKRGYCSRCDSKLPQVRRFVQECNRFKALIHYEEVKNNADKD